jgi:hypothetical protein
MTNGLALTPFPNAIFFNWATIFILAFGNRKFVFLLFSLTTFHGSPSNISATQLQRSISRVAVWQPTRPEQLSLDASLAAWSRS